MEKRDRPEWMTDGASGFQPKPQSFQLMVESELRERVQKSSWQCRLLKEPLADCRSVENVTRTALRISVGASCVLTSNT